MPNPPSLPKLALYHYESCYYCRLVRSTIAELDLEAGVELRDTRETPEYRQELIDVRGRQTVPVLRIEDDAGQVHWLPESQVIVRYLRDLCKGNDTAADPGETSRRAEKLTKMRGMLWFIGLGLVVLALMVS